MSRKKYMPGPGFAGQLGKVGGLSRREYVWVGDFAGQPGNFGHCPAKSMCQSPVLRDNWAISGDVPQKVHARARFCGTTGQFRAMSRKKYVPGPGFAGQVIMMGWPRGENFCQAGKNQREDS